MRMLKCFARIAVPSILTNVAAISSNMANLALAGRMDNASYVAAVGLANTTCAMIILSLVVGLNAAQETLTSQAFGAGNLQLCGLYLNRGMLILLAIFIPVALIPAFFAEQIFTVLGQDPEVSELAASYMKYYVPAMLFHGQYDLIKRWLACQRITFFPMVAMLVSIALHVGLCLCFVKVFDMGINGLALAALVSKAALLIVVSLYAYCSQKVRQVLQPLDREAFTAWGAYLKVALPAMAMICSEWWAFEILVILAGVLSVEALASNIVALTINHFILMVMMGIQEAACTVIGNSIGANNVPLAKRFMKQTTRLSLVILSILCLSFVLARNGLASLFVSDAEVAAITANVILLGALVKFGDGF